MKLGRLRLTCFVALLAVTLTSFPAQAGKGGNGGGGGGGGGGGNGGSNTTNLPPVRYEVGFVPVPGLDGLYDVNDRGEALCVVAIESAPAAITSRFNFTLAVVDATGNISYPELALNTDTDWDLYGARAINNYGDILCLGWINDPSVPDSTALLLVPDAAGRYDVLPISYNDYPYSMNDEGDIALDSKTSGSVTLIDRNSNVVTFPEAITGSNTAGYRSMNSQGQFLAHDNTQTDLGNIWGIQVRCNPDGSVTSFQILPDADVSLYWSGICATDLNDNGIAVGSQQVLEHGADKRYRSEPVIYDVNGQAVWLDAPPAFEVRLNNQNIQGEPVVAGYTVDWSVYYPGEADKNTDLTRDLWIKYPGYQGVYLVDLMDAANQDVWAALEFEDYNYSVPMAFNILTPRLADGSVDDNGFPAMVGFVYNPDNNNGGSFGLGLFVLIPIVTQ